MTQASASAVALTEAQGDEIARGSVARARSGGVELVEPEGLLSGPTKRVLEPGFEEELADHLGYEPHARASHHDGNSRNPAPRRS